MQSLLKGILKEIVKFLLKNITVNQDELIDKIKSMDMDGDERISMAELLEAIL